MGTRIILSDDHKIIREGLRSLFGNRSDMEVVGETKNGHEIALMVQELAPDLIIMAINRPDLNSIDTTRHIIANHPDVKVLVLLIHPDKKFVKKMLKSGASGYMLKDSNFSELINAVHVVLTNRIYLSPDIAYILTNGHASHRLVTEMPAHSTLTFRECEVLKLIAEGKSTKHIASQLCVTDKTVETHRNRIMNKLDIYSIARLTKYAVREGITDL